MADLSDVIDPVTAAIYKHYEQREGSEEARPYLGASIIGKACARALYYDFRWMGRETFDGRMLRLFDTGHRAESRFWHELRSIGAEIYDTDPNTGKQFGFADISGHMRGHMDAAGTNLPGGGKKYHVIEAKTHSEKSFKELKAKGVKAAKPMHYAQLTIYCGWTGMDRALYIAENKNTSELYCERIEFDRVEFEKLRAKAESIIFAEQPPARLSDDPTWYECKFCPHHAVCHGTRVPAVSCRTCCFSTPEREGSEGDWSCSHKHHPTRVIPINVQRTGCNNHLPLPFLVKYAEAVDAGDDWILFRRHDNQRHFVVVGATGMPPVDIIEKYGAPGLYHSSELSAGNGSSIADPFVDEIKATFGGRVVG